MANFFKDNSDLVFTLNNLDLAEVAALREDNYKLAQQFDNAPTSFEDALDNYNRVLEIVGEICGDRIEPRSRIVDRGRSAFRERQGDLSPGDGPESEGSRAGRRHGRHARTPLRRAELPGVGLHDDDRNGLPRRRFSAEHLRAAGHCRDDQLFRLRGAEAEVPAGFCVRRVRRFDGPDRAGLRLRPAVGAPARLAG